MNQIKFIKLNNIFETKIQHNKNNDIINLLNQINIDNHLKSNNNIYIGSLLNNKPSKLSYLLTKNKVLIKGFFDSTINNIQDCDIELDDVILKGNILNQYFNNGTIIYKNTEEKFIGEFNIEGIPNGYCNYINKLTNVSYEGYWLNGTLNGHGNFKNQVLEYVGIFENNFFNGLGKITYFGDYSYDGVFSNGKKNGNGKLIDFKDNKEYYVEMYNDNCVVKLSFLEKQLQDLKNENNSLNNLLKVNNITIQNKEQDIQNLKNEIEQKNSINTELEKKGKCTVCFVENSDTLLPCGHICVCSQCELHIRAYSNRKCPICRKKYLASSIKKVIIS